MPIYEYQCDHCGVFEVNQRITEDSLKKCPTCKRSVRRLISATSFMLKGSGWYATDYGRSKTPASTESSTTGNGNSTESTSSSASTEKSSSSSGSSSGGSTSSGGDKATSST